MNFSHVNIFLVIFTVGDDSWYSRIVNRQKIDDENCFIYLSYTVPYIV